MGPTGMDLGTILDMAHQMESAESMVWSIQSFFFSLISDLIRPFIFRWAPEPIPACWVIGLALTFREIAGNVNDTVPTMSLCTSKIEYESNAGPYHGWPTYRLKNNIEWTALISPNPLEIKV